MDIAHPQAVGYRVISFRKGRSLPIVVSSLGARREASHGGAVIKKQRGLLKKYLCTVYFM